MSSHVTHSKWQLIKDDMDHSKMLQKTVSNQVANNIPLSVRKFKVTDIVFIIHSEQLITDVKQNSSFKSPPYSSTFPEAPWQVFRRHPCNRAGFLSQGSSKKLLGVPSGNFNHSDKFPLTFIFLATCKGRILPNGHRCKQRTPPPPPLTTKLMYHVL